MAIQIGTVDGLINISEDKIRILINAINAFDKKCIAKAQANNIALGTAFQRFVEPVYKDPKRKFDINSISIPAITKSGKEQSPSKVTYCKKMGLLEMEESLGIFQLTPLGKALYENDINVSDYAIILLSKMGVFVDDNYVNNLLVLLGEYYQNRPVTTENQLTQYLTEKYNETDFIKTRIDIILGAMSIAGLLYKAENGGYYLDNILSSQILNTFINNKNKVAPAILDNNPNYSNYMGSLRNGIFDIIDKSNEYLFRIRYPNIFKFISFISQGSNKVQKVNSGSIGKVYSIYLDAIKTKPFLLLAGISGTGKSRIVRELAFKSCPSYLQDKDGTTPGNYCMIEVKPNWHDSTELLGYHSNLVGKYQFKKFVKFLVKAKMFPEVPFFVCLDEMNLAPVEQYFAEILSILETRKHPKDHKDFITSGVIIEPEHFRNLGTLSSFREKSTGNHPAIDLTDRDIYMKLYGLDDEKDIAENLKDKRDLTEVGLTLPDNVIIIGTVNMDDTTHPFSRKVIDRAMTIEMNGDKLKDMFGGSKKLDYSEEKEQQKWQGAFKQPYVSADEVIENHSDFAEQIITVLPSRLEEINQALKGTPFEVSYRVLNELTIMVGVMLDQMKEDESFEDIVNSAINNILLMKILPRVEGDSEMFELPRDSKYANKLEWLKDLAPEIKSKSNNSEIIEENSEDKEDDSEQTPKENKNIPETVIIPSAKDKIQEMIDRLYRQDFTRFWP